jgi:hypothetical protein
MSKADAIFRNFSLEHMSPDPAFGKPCSPSGWEFKDKRLPHLLVTLQQLDEFLHRLEGVPESEVSEIVSAALRVCGFVEPIEAFEVIAVILDALEKQDPVPERPPFPAYRGSPS